MSKFQVGDTVRVNSSCLVEDKIGAVGRVLAIDGRMVRTDIGRRLLLRETSLDLVTPAADILYRLKSDVTDDRLRQIHLNRSHADGWVGEHFKKTTDTYYFESSKTLASKYLHDGTGAPFHFPDDVVEEVPYNELNKGATVSELDEYKVRVREYATRLWRDNSEKFCEESFVEAMKALDIPPEPEEDNYDFGTVLMADGFTSSMYGGWMPRYTVYLIKRHKKPDSWIVFDWFTGKVKYDDLTLAEAKSKALPGPRSYEWRPVKPK